MLSCVRLCCPLLAKGDVIGREKNGVSVVAGWKSAHASTLAASLSFLSWVHIPLHQFFFITRVRAFSPRGFIP